MFKSIRIGAVDSPLTVAGVFSDDTALPKSIARQDADGAWRTARSRPGFRADAGEVAVVDGTRALLGLGARKDLTKKALRVIGARLARRLDAIAPKGVRLLVAEALEAKTLAPAEAGCALGEGMGLGNWRVDFFDGTATKREPAKGELMVESVHKSFRAGLEKGLLLADATNYARRLAATPPNICNPTFVAAEAKKLAKETGLGCRVIDFAEAKTLGMGGLVNVGMASASKPCLIVLSYTPEGTQATSARGGRGSKSAAKPVKPLALVGKTLTYDTGGYSLKVNNGMKGMKYDKNGGMAVLGAMRAIAALKPKIPVTAFLPAAENMVAGDAYRPDDIITMCNGVTVEVTNTDAEGRLVLADALAYACKEYQPRAIVDMATLTGGVVVALGAWCAGLWCDDDALRARLDEASAATDERLWRLPLWEEHRDFMRGKHADLWNSGPKRDAHPIQGAAFLSFFVEPTIPWAHIDIAGTSSVESDTDLAVTGPTGYGVRLLVELAASYRR